MPGGINIFALAQRMNRPLLLDGAMGSRLNRGAGAYSSRWAASANTLTPSTVVRLHKRYIAAGADIITTNTFRTNPAAFVRAGEPGRARDEAHHAVRLARVARGSLPVLIAGCNPPAEDCYARTRTLSKRALLANHKEHLLALADAGCDLLLNETLGFLDEVELVSSICKAESLPFIVSIIVFENGRLASGEPAARALECALNAGALAVGINCVSPAEVLSMLYPAIRGIPWGCYPNCGTPDTFAFHGGGKTLRVAVTPAALKGWFASVSRFRPAFIGTCCGSGPEHTKALLEVINEKIYHTVTR